MILDGHAHVEPELGVDGLVAAMDAAGVAQAVLIGAAQEPIGKINPLGPPIFRACLRVRPLRIPIYRIGRSTMHQHRHRKEQPHEIVLPCQGRCHRHQAEQDAELLGIRARRSPRLPWHHREEAEPEQRR